jgi:hypothetical protein
MARLSTTEQSGADCDAVLLPDLEARKAQG